MGKNSTKKATGPIQAREGDIYYDAIDGKYNPYQVLKVDDYGENGQIHHLKIFKAVETEPSEDDIDKLEVLAWHAPFEPIQGSTYLGHRDIKPEDLQGFHVYLKMTDFRRYLEETGADVDAVVARAKEYYSKGNAAADAGEFEEAIDWFNKAIDELPPFYEAIDNKGLAFMDLARWEEAIACFEESLKLNRDSITAAFSIGECLYRMGKFEDAAQQFQAALAIKPGDPLSMEWLEKARNAAHPHGSA
ncbi:MAG: tetratricopeptide repeat protein [Candidatus Lokiarchaeota archaeon]|nr:tetratricopeptide repeat protein [Candidatus Lokiarchaeota archaeon]